MINEYVTKVIVTRITTGHGSSDLGFEVTAPWDTEPWNKRPVGKFWKGVKEGDELEVVIRKLDKR